MRTFTLPPGPTPHSLLLLWHILCARACSLRALYGTDGTQNATHGSDSPASAAREIKFFFPSLSLAPGDTASAASAAEYITAQLQPALAKALTALARDKPSADKFEAITFLANYLLANNPNKPRIVTPEEWTPTMAGAADDDDEADFAGARLVVPPAPGQGGGDDSQARAEYEAMLAAATAKPAPPTFHYVEESRTATPLPLQPTPPAGAKPPSRPTTAQAAAATAASDARPPSRSATSPPPAAAVPAVISRPGSAATAAPVPAAQEPARGAPSRQASAAAAPPDAKAPSRPASAAVTAVAAMPSPDPAANSPADDEADAAAAAVKVQAAFRGYQARKEVSVMRTAQAGEGEGPQEAAAKAAEGPDAETEAEATAQGEAEAEAAPGAAGQEVFLPKSVAAEEAEAAATRVQAHMRGHLARKQVAQLKAEQQQALPAPAAGGSRSSSAARRGAAAAPAEAEAEAEVEGGAEQPDAWEDKEAEAEAAAPASSLGYLPEGVAEEEAALAATKVQAHMRGHLARKQVAQLKAERQGQSVAQVGEPSYGGQVEGEADPEGEQ